MVTIHEGHWAPVSAGEYDRRTGSISINVAVVDQVHARFGHARAAVIAAIVAHERVHLLLRMDPSSPHDEERRARDAAIAASGADVVAHIDDVLAAAWV